MLVELTKMGGLYTTGGGVVGFKGFSDLVVGVALCGELAGLACAGLCPAVNIQY